VDWRVASSDVVLKHHVTRQNTPIHNMLYILSVGKVRLCIEVCILNAVSSMLRCGVAGYFGDFECVVGVGLWELWGCGVCGGVGGVGWG
jgi:hypothetical protein